MAAVDDIVLNIVLSGNQDVGAAFDRLRQAGERLFVGLDSAAASSAGALGTVATAVAGVGAALTVAGVGAFAFTKSMSDIVDTISDLSDATGSTTEEISGLKAAFAGGGVGPGELEQAYRRLSTSISTSWTEIKRAHRDGADQARSNNNSVISANQALADSIKKVADADRDFANQRKQNALDVESASQRLQSARLNEAKLAGADTSQAERALQADQARTATKKAALDFAQAQRRQAEQAENEERQRIKDAVAADNAEIARRQALRKEEDDRRNNIDNVIDAVQRLSEGETGALKGINATAENLAKGIIGAAGESGKALGSLKGDITDLASGAPGVQDVFQKLGEVLGEIEDPALRSATAARLLGRSVSQDLLEVLSDPSKIQQFKDRVKELGIAVTEVDAQAMQKFRSALFGLQNDVQLVGAKIGSAMAPGFTQLLEAIDAFVVGSKDSLVEFGNSVSDVIGPASETLARSIKGIPDAAKDADFTAFTRAFNLLAEAIGNMASLIGDASSAIVGSIQKILDKINELSGSNLTVLNAPFKALTVVMTGLAFAIQAAVDALTLLQKGLGKKGDEGFESDLKGAQERAKALADIITGDISKGIDDYKKSMEEQGKREDEFAQRKKTAAREQRDAKREEIDNEQKLAKAKEETRAKEANQQRQLQNERTRSNQERAKEVSDVKELSNLRQRDRESNTQALSDKERADELQKRVEREAIDRAARKAIGKGNVINTQDLPEQLAPVTGTVEEALKEARRRAAIHERAREIQQQNRIDSDPTLGGLGPVSGLPLEEIERRRQQAEQQRAFEERTRQPFPDSPFQSPFAPEQANAAQQQAGLDGIRQAIVDGIQQIVDAFVQNENAKDGSEGTGEQAAQDLEGDFEELSSSLDQTDQSLDGFGSAADEAALAIENLANALGALDVGNSGGGGDATESFAEGGQIGGRPHSRGGTIIEAERGEFIHPVRATQHYGLAFMESIRTLRFPRFAEGGLVNLGALPRFAEGGPVVAESASAPNNQIIGRVDLTTNHGSLNVPVDKNAFDQISRLATTKRITSTSKKKPGFVS